jgi:hypothetical protein
VSAIMDPTGHRRTAATAGLSLAQRPRALARARVGLLENGKQNARAMLEAVAAVLKERYGVGDVVIRRKEVFSAPAPPELVQELSAAADLVVIGVGD